MSIGEKIYDAMLTERTRGPLNRDRWIAVANVTIEMHKQSKKRKATPGTPGTPAAKPRPRNPLFDALGTATGTNDVSQLTRNGAKAIGVALADILEVNPEVTVAEIERVVRAYKSRHATWPCTPFAIAKHWAEFAKGDRTQSAKKDIYQEPIGWTSNEKARLTYHASVETWQLMAEKGWFDLAPDIRADILRAL